MWTMDLPSCAMDLPGCPHRGGRLAIHLGDADLDGEVGAHVHGGAGHDGSAGDHAGADLDLDHQELLGDLCAGLDDVATLAVQLDGAADEVAQLGDELPGLVEDLCQLVDTGRPWSLALNW
jgi:hypothetical protein